MVSQLRLLVSHPSTSCNQIMSGISRTLQLQKAFIIDSWTNLLNIWFIHYLERLDSVVRALWRFYWAGPQSDADLCLGGYSLASVRCCIAPRWREIWRCMLKVVMQNVWLVRDVVEVRCHLMLPLRLGGSDVYYEGYERHARALLLTHDQISRAVHNQDESLVNRHGRGSPDAQPTYHAPCGSASRRSSRRHIVTACLWAALQDEW